MIEEFLVDNCVDGRLGDSIQIHRGSIGWEDEDEWFFIGDGTNDGFTFIRVQLFTGRDVTTPLNPNRAQGTKILCHLGGGMFRIPKKDTPCYVALEAGHDQCVVQGVIIATIEKSPPTQFGEKRVVVDYGDDTHVVFNAKSISLQDPDNRFISVGTPFTGGTPGITLQASNGTGGAIQENAVGWWVADGGSTKSMIQMTKDDISCLSTKGGMWKLDANFYALGTTATLAAGGVYLGKAPTIANPALWGLTGIVGVASPSVYISPI